MTQNKRFLLNFLKASQDTLRNLACSVDDSIFESKKCTHFVKFAFENSKKCWSKVNAIRHIVAASTALYNMSMIVNADFWYEIVIYQYLLTHRIFTVKRYKKFLEHKTHLRLLVPGVHYGQILIFYKLSEGLDVTNTRRH